MQKIRLQNQIKKIIQDLLKALLLFMLLFFATTGFAQTKEETIKWLNSKTIPNLMIKVYKEQQLQGVYLMALNG